MSMVPTEHMDFMRNSPVSANHPFGEVAYALVAVSGIVPPSDFERMQNRVSEITFAELNGNALLVYHASRLWWCWIRSGSRVKQ